jgi:hypothetical protein
MLTSKIPENLPGSLAYGDPLIARHLRQSLPYVHMAVLSDQDVHFNKIGGFDVLMIFHQEYVTQQEYDNLKNFVADGGTLVLFDGNVFMAEVNYNASTNSVTLVSGHTWRYNKGYASMGPIFYNKGYASIGPVERWAAETSEWTGSNYYHTTPNVTFYNNPFGYHHGEEQVVTTDPRTIQIIMNYNAVNANPAFEGEPFLASDRPITTTHPLIATYVKDYGRGKVIVLGLYGDYVVSNPQFLKFFDNVLEKYALGTNIPLEPRPTVRPNSSAK